MNDMSPLRQLPPLFFLGLFPVVILLWAWADSVGHATVWYRSPTGESVDQIYIVNSALVVEHAMVNPTRPDLDDPFPGDGGFGHFNRLPNGSGFTGEPSLFPAFERTSVDPAHLSRNDPFLVSLSSLPFWLILLAYLPLWAGLSWWQACRRRAKLRAALPAPAAG